MCPIQPKLTTLPHDWQQMAPSLRHPYLLFLWHALTDKAGHLEQRKRKPGDHKYALKWMGQDTESFWTIWERVFLQYKIKCRCTFYGNNLIDSD